MRRSVDLKSPLVSSSSVGHLAVDSSSSSCCFEMNIISTPNSRAWTKALYIDGGVEGIKVKGNDDNFWSSGEGGKAA